MRRRARPKTSSIPSAASEPDPTAGEEEPDEPEPVPTMGLQQGQHPRVVRPAFADEGAGDEAGQVQVSHGNGVGVADHRR